MTEAYYAAAAHRIAGAVLARTGDCDGGTRSRRWRSSRSAPHSLLTTCIGTAWRTSGRIESSQSLPGSVIVRSGDALHLSCAEHGVREVYTNERHLLHAAKHFEVVGVNVLDK